MLLFFRKKKNTVALRNQICIVAYEDGQHPIFGSNEQYNFKIGWMLVQILRRTTLFHRVYQ